MDNQNELSAKEVNRPSIEAIVEQAAKEYARLHHDLQTLRNQRGALNDRIKEVSEAMDKAGRVARALTPRSRKT